jgi:hypothetical protein
MGNVAKKIKKNVPDFSRNEGMRALKVTFGLCIKWGKGAINPLSTLEHRLTSCKLADILTQHSHFQAAPLWRQSHKNSMHVS